MIGEALSAVNVGGSDPPKTLDMKKELRAAWKRAWPDAGHERQTNQLPRALSQLTGWPVSASSAKARPLAEAIAANFVRRLKDSERYKDVLDAAPDHLGPAWRDLLYEAFRCQAADVYRRERSSLKGADALSKYLVGGFLRHDEPAVIGGPEKACKTLLSVELAAAATTGTSFLGLPVAHRCAVWALTLETSPDLWIERFVRAVESRGHDGREALGRLTVTKNLADLRTKAGRRDLRDFFEIDGVTVAIMDPLYLLLPRVSAADLGAQGRALRSLIKPMTGAEHCITPVFVHHFVKSLQPGTLPTLRDLSGSAVGPFARSWCLVNRRTSYSGDGVHDLLAQVGTGAGDCMQARLRFDERAWEVTAEPIGEEPCEASGDGAEIAARPSTPAYLKRRG